MSREFASNVSKHEKIDSTRNITSDVRKRVVGDEKEASPWRKLIMNIMMKFSFLRLIVEMGKYCRKSRSRDISSQRR